MYSQASARQNFKKPVVFKVGARPVTSNCNVFPWYVQLLEAIKDLKNNDEGNRLHVDGSGRSRILRRLKFFETLVSPETGYI